MEAREIKTEIKSSFNPKLIERMEELTGRFKTLLNAVEPSPPEFIQINRLFPRTYGSTIAIEENWYKATNRYVDGNIVVEPKYYIQLENLFSEMEFARIQDPNSVDEDTFFYIEWMEGETIGSGLITMTSKQFRQYHYGRLQKMLERHQKEQYAIHKANFSPMEEEWYKEFLNDEEAIIHIIISVHDQDSVASIRKYVLGREGNDELAMAFHYLTERTDLGDFFRWY